MLLGVNGNPYYDLTPIVDINQFRKLHPSICRGFATARHLSSQGSLDVPDGFFRLEAYDNKFKPLFQGYREYSKLSDNDPLKLNGKGLSGNNLATYLKFAIGGYDLYSFYVLCDFTKGWRESTTIHYKPISDHFPEVKNFLNYLIANNIFSSIGRATFFVLEAGGISFEHRDPAIDPEHPEIASEFIHFRINLDRPFYVRDPETEIKTYIDSCAGYWNDQDYHGGDVVQKPSYSFRVDGTFTDAFKEKMNGIN